MANKLSDRNKVLFYDYMVEYEIYIAQEFGHYNNKSQSVIDFCDKNKILIGSSCKTNMEQRFQYKHYILWDDKKPEKFSAIKGNDSAHNLLRHIRNAMAHGNIVGENRQKLSLSDFNESGRQTMIGNISMAMFYKLLDIIKQTHD